LDAAIHLVNSLQRREAEWGKKLTLTKLSLTNIVPLNVVKGTRLKVGNVYI